MALVCSNLQSRIRPLRVAASAGGSVSDLRSYLCTLLFLGLAKLRCRKSGMSRNRCWAGPRPHQRSDREWACHYRKSWALVGVVDAGSTTNNGCNTTPVPSGCPTSDPSIPTPRGFPHSVAADSVSNQVYLPIRSSLFGGSFFLLEPSLAPQFPYSASPIQSLT